MIGISYIGKHLWLQERKSDLGFKGKVNIGGV